MKNKIVLKRNSKTFLLWLLLIMIFMVNAVQYKNWKMYIWMTQQLNIDKMSSSYFKYNISTLSYIIYNECLRKCVLTILVCNLFPTLMIFFSSFCKVIT